MPIGLKGNTDGSGAVQIGGSDAISISTALNTTFAGTVTATGTVAGSTGTLYPLVADTVRTATGTAIDFTGIPSWVRRITVIFNQVSLNGSSSVLVQIGSGSVTTSGYFSGSSGTNNAGLTSTSGFLVIIGGGTTSVVGTMSINLLTGASYISSHSGYLGGTTVSVAGGGAVALSGVLDRVRITTVNGTDAFDAGAINILYE